MSKEWTEKDDDFLVRYGPVLGYDFVAEHDLGKPPGSGSKRINELRRTRPDFVAAVEAEEAVDEREFWASLDGP